MKKYCSTCGSPTEYNSQIPKFCASCGQSFDGVTKTATKSPSRARARVEEVNEDIEEETPLEIPEKIDVDVESYTPSRGVKFEEVFASGGGGDFSRPIPKIDKKQVLESFRREAGTTRKDEQ